MVVFCSNLLFAVFGLVFIVIFSCCILFLLHVEFLSFIMMLIYVGAMVILFLFVIMMLQLNLVELDTQLLTVFNSSFLIYFFLILKCLYFLIIFNKKLSILIYLLSFEFGTFNDLISKGLINDSLLFLNLFSQNFFFFVIIGIILLFSMFGSIALCIKENKF